MPTNGTTRTATQRSRRMDMHCHSHASNGPAMAALGFIDVPECYSPPEKIYDQARTRGMDFVTITDHDTIAGAMELVERGFEDFIVGEEVTVYFPEDHCKLHVLVWDLTPELHEQIHTLKLRDDVYDFAAWLRERDLPHSLAHPLYVQNNKLDIWHLERAALLFRGFEMLNGAHSVTHRDALRRFLDSLSPARISALVRSHKIEPLWPEPWRKSRTGGSDDHALLNVGRTYTEVAAPVETVQDFVSEVTAFRSDAAGVGGHAALLAHQLNKVGWTYTARQVEGKGNPRSRYGRMRLFRLIGFESKAPGRIALAWDTFKRKVLKLGKPTHPFLSALKHEMPPLLEKHPEIARRLDPDLWDDGSALSAHEQMEAFSLDLVRALTRRHAQQTRSFWTIGRKGAATRELTALLAAQAVQIPYLFSLLHQNKERWLVDRLEHRLADAGEGVSATERPIRVMLFTDTLGDVNGVTRFIRTMGEHAAQRGHELTVVSSTNKPAYDAPWIHNFKPHETIDLPGYPQIDLVLPPVIEMLRLVDQQQPDVVHASTPGPVGLVGRLAAKVVRAPVVATYHTDFPAFVERIFDDHSMTKIAETFMKRFYENVSTVLTRSESYIPKLEALGVPSPRLRALPGATDSQAFHPSKRNTDIWREHKLDPDSVKVLSCGRVSVEKNLPLLAAAWKQASARLAASGIHADLIVLGDGPYRNDMERELKGARATFLGFRSGEELATLYASCDFLAFPSETDTLGQVVLEAHASGLPALVSPIGGPSEIIENTKTGRVIHAGDVASWTDAITDLASDHDTRAAMGRAARAHVEPMTTTAMYDAFWDAHKDAWKDRLIAEGLTPTTAGADLVENPNPANVAS